MNLPANVENILYLTSNEYKLLISSYIEHNFADSIADKKKVLVNMLIAFREYAIREIVKNLRIIQRVNPDKETYIKGQFVSYMGYGGKIKISDDGTLFIILIGKKYYSTTICDNGLSFLFGIFGNNEISNNYYKQNQRRINEEKIAHINTVNGYLNKCNKLVANLNSIYSEILSEFHFNLNEEEKDIMNQSIDEHENLHIEKAKMYTDLFRLLINKSDEKCYEFISKYPNIIYKDHTIKRECMLINDYKISYLLANSMFCKVETMNIPKYNEFNLAVPFMFECTAKFQTKKQYIELYNEILIDYPNTDENTRRDILYKKMRETLLHVKPITDVKKIYIELADVIKCGIKYMNKDINLIQNYNARQQSSYNNII